MILYSVVHSNLFEHELATLWMLARNAGDVSAASNAIDRTLQYDPELKGELVSGKLRRIAEGPVWVYYTVEPDDRKAILWSIRWAKE
jgi:hypothetical protein